MTSTLDTCERTQLSFHPDNDWFGSQAITASLKNASVVCAGMVYTFAKRKWTWAWLGRESLIRGCVCQPAMFRFLPMIERLHWEACRKVEVRFPIHQWDCWQLGVCPQWPSSPSIHRNNDVTKPQALPCIRINAQPWPLTSINLPLTSRSQKYKCGNQRVLENPPVK